MREMRRAFGLRLALVLSSGLEFCSGQQGLFEWGFNSCGPNQCEECSLSILNGSFGANANFGVPPYYLVAFEAGGFPTTSLVGSNPKNLTWRVDHGEGSVLLLEVIDGNGNSGGVDNKAYSVGNSGIEDCILPTAPKNDISIQTNVTDGTIQTCETVGFWISGGVKPYSISLAAENSSTVVNHTIGLTDDVLVYVSRLAPNEQVIVAVSDQNGKWGSSSPLLRTSGSNNTDCAGQQFMSGSSVVIPNPNLTSNPTTSGIATPSSSPSATQTPSSQLTSDGTKSNVPVIPIVVPVAAVLLLCALGFYFWRRRRSRFFRSQRAGPAILADAWPSSSFQDSPALSTRAPAAALYSKIPSDSFLLSPINRPPASSESHGLHASADETQDTRATVGVIDDRAGPQITNGADNLGNVIQHRDAGAVPLQEIPPPYADYMSPRLAGQASAANNDDRPRYQTKQGMHVS